MREALEQNPVLSNASILVSDRKNMQTLENNQIYNKQVSHFIREQ